MSRKNTSSNHIQEHLDKKPPMSHSKIQKVALGLF